MPRYIRSGVKHGGVTGGTRPNSHKTNVMPGTNPRGDGKVSCGHPATQPGRYILRKVARYKFDKDTYDPRRVCEDCFTKLMSDPESPWRECDSEGQHEPTLEDDLRGQVINLQVELAAVESQLKSRPDWPVIQKLAKLALDVEKIVRDERIDYEQMVAHYMDSEIQHFMVWMDRYNLLPDGKPGRVIVKPKAQRGTKTN